MLIFDNVKSPHGDIVDNDFKSLIKSPKVRDSKDGSLYSFAVLTPGETRRVKENVIGSDALVFDYDNDADVGHTLPSDLKKKLHGLEYYWHSTHSNTPDKPKWRLVIPFEYMCSVDRWDGVWNWFYNYLGKDPNIDTSCKSIVRAYYFPSCPADMKEFSFKGYKEGALLDPLSISTTTNKELKAPAVENIVTTLDDVKSALEFLDPDCSYEDWVHVGMAIKDEYGDAGYHVWDDWSRNGAKYTGGTRIKWNSFRPSGGGITIATLFGMAKDNGWVREYPRQEDEAWKDVIIFEGGNLRPTKKDQPVPDVLIDSAPHLVGLVAQWIVDSARKPQPELALAAAISAVGVVMGHRFATETDLRSNMLTMGVGPSGCGKDHPRKCITKLFKAARLSKLLGGTDVTSGTAILTALKRGLGRQLFSIDEMGRVLKAWNSKNASSAQQEISTTMMALFSSASTMYFGKEFANQQERERITIDQPCLCVHGSTVPDHFYEAMGSSDAADGFLSRWLIFETKIRTPKKNYKCGLYSTPPVALVDVFRELATIPKADGNLSDMDQEIKPTVIPCDAQARKILEEFEDYCEERGNVEYDKKSGLDSLWTRGFEHASKLALIAHDWEKECIDAEVAQWAVNLVTFLINKNIAIMSDKISENEVESTSKRVLAVIRGHKDWMSRSDLTKKTQWLKARERNDILKNLEDAEYIKLKIEQDGGTKKPTTLYAAV